MNQTHRIFNLTVIVSALGYFVDIYDLLLFSIVRQQSLKDLGLVDGELLSSGVLLLNAQMLGLLMGGVIWGVWGDRKGRISVLFGSILLYSVANIANGFVHTLELYAVLRFVAGIGLAGELGAAITLVGETMTRETRGYGTTIVASVGILGAVFANLIGSVVTWRVAYVIGGVMGLMLLLLRVSVFESGLFEKAKAATGVRRGDLTMLVKPLSRLRRYLGCVLIGIPIWYVIGILVTFSPELAKELNVTGAIQAGSAVMYAYMGLSLGDLASGLLSQKLKSRKKVIFIFMILNALGIGSYFFLRDVSTTTFYFLCTFLGFASGYWAIFITTASENFGTNLRATVASTVPNFVRGSVVPLTLAFHSLAPAWGRLPAAAGVGAVTWVIGALALFILDETFHRDLSYLEHHD